MESILEKYKEDLDKETRLNITLARIYTEMFDQEPSQKLFMMFEKLLKVYPKESVIMALLDMYDMENITYDKIYNLIVFLVKKRYENELQGSQPVNNLTGYAKEIERKLERKGK